MSVTQGDLGSSNKECSKTFQRLFLDTNFENNDKETDNGSIWREYTSILVSATNTPELRGCHHCSKIPFLSLSYPTSVDKPSLSLPFSSLSSALPHLLSFLSLLCLFILHKSAKVCFCCLQPKQSDETLAQDYPARTCVTAEIWNHLDDSKFVF